MDELVGRRVVAASAGLANNTGAGMLVAFGLRTNRMVGDLIAGRASAAAPESAVRRGEGVEGGRSDSASLTLGLMLAVLRRPGERGAEARAAAGCMGCMGVRGCKWGVICPGRAAVAC